MQKDDKKANKNFSLPKQRFNRTQSINQSINYFIVRLKVHPYSTYGPEVARDSLYTEKNNNN